MQPADVLVSGEGVALELPTAGLASRAIAALIDAGLQGLTLLVLVLLGAAAVGPGIDSAALTAIVIVEFVLVLGGYPVVMEWLTRGRTLGKIVMGLRVVRDDGGPIGFRQALVRGLAGLVIEKPGLIWPFSTIAGVVTLTSSRRDKRIGDMMAGTVVLDERAGAPPLAPLPVWVPVPLQHWVLSLDLHRLDDALALTLREFVGRAHDLHGGAQIALGEQLRERVLALTTPPPPPGTPTPVLLQSVLVERRRRAAAFPAGAGR